eukprot:259773-Pleurochrysis_carterae.AAC.2
MVSTASASARIVVSSPGVESQPANCATRERERPAASHSAAERSGRGGGGGCGGPYFVQHLEVVLPLEVEAVLADLVGHRVEVARVPDEGGADEI